MSPPGGAHPLAVAWVEDVGANADVGVVTKGATSVTSTYDIPESLAVERTLAPTDADGRPDFDALYPKLSLGAGAGRGDLLWELGPDAARRAAAVAEQLAEVLVAGGTASSRVAERHLGSRVASRCRQVQDHDAEELLACFAAVAQQTRVRLECGEVPWPRCVADELVLRAVVSAVVAEGLPMTEVMGLQRLNGEEVVEPFLALAATTWSDSTPPQRWFLRFVDGKPLDLGIRR